MLEDDGPDEVQAMDLLTRFSSAVFEKDSLLGALVLCSPRMRRGWAEDWVTCASEDGGRELEDEAAVAEALASLDKQHPAWFDYARDTLAAWRKMWHLLPTCLALDPVERRRVCELHLGWYVSVEELVRRGATWAPAPPPGSGPAQLSIEFEAVDGVLMIAELNASN